MVVSWTPLFVLFHLGLPADPHKPALKIATMPFRATANRKNPFRKRRPDRTEFPGFTGASSPAVDAATTRGNNWRLIKISLP
jgi:hypothetical protein